jgi:hypothetical protein
LAAILFLFQRGLGTGLTVYAPAIIFIGHIRMEIFTYMNIVIGVLLLFTLFWWNKSSKRNQKTTNVRIMSGMLITFSYSIFYQMI